MLSVGRSVSSELTLPSGRQTCQQSSRRPGDDSALTSMTSSSGPPPSSASCPPSWASTRQSARKWPLASGRCRLTCTRTETLPPMWLFPSVRWWAACPETAASTWTAWVQITPTGRRSPSSRIWSEQKHSDNAFGGTEFVLIDGASVTLVHPPGGFPLTADWKHWPTRRSRCLRPRACEALISQVQHLFANLCAVVEPNENGALGPKRQSEQIQPLEVQEENEGADRGSGTSTHPQTGL